MKKYITVLVITAILQLALVVMTWTGENKLETQTAQSVLLSFNPAGLDHIILRGGERETVLDKQDGEWKIHGGFPADQNKIKVFLQKLAGLKIGFPIATSPAALTRFKVAKDHYEQYIQLKKGDEIVAELYLGTGAGVRRTHAGSGAQNAVYTVSLGSYDVPVNVESWQDKTVLWLDKKDVIAVQLGDLIIHRESTPPEKSEARFEDSTAGDGTAAVWEIDQPLEHQSLNQKAVNQGLDKLLSLDFISFLGQQEKPKEYGLETPALQLTLTLEHGKRTYRFAHLKDSTDYVLKVSDRPEYFKISGSIGTSIVENITQDKWEVTAEVLPPVEIPSGSPSATPNNGQKEEGTR